MTTYTTTDKPPVGCDVYSQQGKTISASFPCGCVIEEIVPTLMTTFYTCKCGETRFYVKAECHRWTRHQKEIEQTLNDVEFMLRNEGHIRPWVRRLRSIIRVALRKGGEHA